MTPETSPLVPGLDVRIDGAPQGLLDGMRFAAKDLFDVAGYPTGGGNPDWQAPVPTKHAWLVQTLLDAGADLTAKTITDEVSLGILGENAFYGTPLNPKAPEHVPGGSSSGSASIVATGDVDFAIGTDTGGSVRVPASFCGLFGIRPTHGRLNLSGMIAQAPRSDTAGWFARDAETFAKVSEVVLGERTDSSVSKLLVAVDAFGIADPTTAAALQPAVDALAELVGERCDETMSPPGLSVWAKAQRTLQPWEGWLTFKDWLDKHNPRMAYSVARNLALASMIPESERQWAEMMRLDARARMHYLLDAQTVLCMPTTPFPAPPKGLPVDTQTPLRNRIACLCSHGGLTGVCQVSVPVTLAEGRPVGLSLVGAPGADATLVALAGALAEAINL
ncbi:MAG: glutamyl-tRNA amidotransferase [Gammaproteobacteria bacterium]|nr:glutamyl-tRNA amidotransferase [Gammaproteobacteria bacterium]